MQFEHRMKSIQNFGHEPIVSFLHWRGSQKDQTRESE